MTADLRREEIARIAAVLEGLPDDRPREPHWARALYDAGLRPSLDTNEPCCSEENPHRVIPTITDRTRIARHWFDEAAVFPATKMYAASDIDAAPADDRRVREGRLVPTVGHRDPGVARSQDTATARIAALEGAISNYIVTVTRAAHRPDHPNYQTPEQVEARYRELLDTLNARAVLSGETRTGGETAE